MRIPLVTQLSTKDGSSDKNARMTNTLVAKNPTGTSFAEVRPGLNRLADTTGNGNGIVDFNGEIFSVYGSQLEFVDVPSKIGYGTRNLSAENGTFFAHAEGISPSGDIIVGWGYESSTFAGYDYRACYWTEASGVIYIDTGSLVSFAFGVTDDFLIVGAVETGVGTGLYNPFVWSIEGGITTIAFTTGQPSIVKKSPNAEYFIPYNSSSRVNTVTQAYNDSQHTPSAIANNGTVVSMVGTGVAFEVETWAGTVTSVTIPEGTTIVYLTINGDGDKVCGVIAYSSINPGYTTNRKLFTWDAINGTQVQSLTGGYMYTLTVSANSMSENGEVLCGWFYDGALRQPFIFRNGGFQLLDLFTETGSTYTEVINISADGRTVVGYYYNDEDPQNPVNAHFVWNDDMGVQAIPYITNGDPYTQETQSVISADGFTVAITEFLFNEFYQEAVGQLTTWQPDTGIFRSLATLEDQFFDFAQSTL